MNDNNRYYKKSMMAAAETVYIDISLLIITPASCFFMSEYGFWDKRAH